MELIMTIGDTFTMANVGHVIVGVNKEITKHNTSKLCKAGDEIVVIKENNNFNFKVLDVKLSFSFSEAVIVSIMVEKSIYFHKLKSGDLVYKI